MVIENDLEIENRRPILLTIYITRIFFKFQDDLYVQCICKYCVVIPLYLHVSGMRPLMYSEKDAFEKQKGWVRTGHHIK